MAEHTPLPWRYEKVSRFDECDITGDGRTIALVYSSDGMDEATDMPAEPNAALIVRACNSHDALVTTLLQCQVMLLNYAAFDTSLAHHEDAEFTRSFVLKIDEVLKSARPDMALPSHVLVPESDAQSLETREVQS